MGGTLKLLDHLVSGRQKRRGHRQIERASGLMIDDQLKLGRLQDRKVRWHRTLEDATDIDARFAPSVWDVGPITHQSADFDYFARPVTCREGILGRKDAELYSSAEEKAVVANEQSIDLPASEGCKGLIDLAASAGVENLCL